MRSKKIEREISELSSDGGDYSEQRDFDKRIADFKGLIEKSAQNLMEFWSQFNDDKPDLHKLQEVGQRLFPIKEQIEERWNRL